MNFRGMKKSCLRCKGIFVYVQFMTHQLKKVLSKLANMSNKEMT